MISLLVADAVTNRPFAGNSAAAVVVDEFPEDLVTQRVAREMNCTPERTGSSRRRPRGR